MADPIGFIEKECLISPSQLHTLSTTPFARHDHVFPHDYQDDIDDDNDRDFWDQSSDDDGVGGGGAEDVDVSEIRIVFRSPPPSPDTATVSNDVVLEVKKLEADNNDVVLKEEFVSAGISTSMKAEVTTGTRNGVVLGVQGELRFASKNLKVCDDSNDVVSGIADKLGFAAKKLKVCDDSNDVVSGITDELGFGAKKLKVPDTNDAPNDVVLEIDDELGCIGERKRFRDDCVSSSSQFPMPAKKLKLSDTNDVVLEEKSVAASLRTPTEAENLNRPQDDVVLSDSIDLGFLGGRNTSAAKKLRFSDAEEKETDTQEVIIEDETEKLIESECDVDTEVVKEDEDEDDDEEEEDEVRIDEKSSGDAMECLVKMLRVLSESKRNKNGEEEKEAEFDFLETAKRRGYTFPTPRRLLL